MKGPSTACLLVVGALLVGACDAPSLRDPQASAAADSVAAARAARVADSLAARLAARADSAFRRVEPLSGAETGGLRRFLQDEHLALARRLGIDPLRDRRAAAEHMSRPPRESGVVQLHTSDFYIVDPRMGYAVPLLVPSAAHLLDHVGQGLERELRARGLPPFRFILTNVLRTGIDQAHLRGTNVNAAQGQSTHEYGTTFDIYYGRYHYAPARDSLAHRAARSAGVDDVALRRRLRRAYRELGRTRAEEVSALLGRTLLRLQEEGMLVATYERRQPVFHVTVARTVPPLPGVPDTPDPAAPLRRFYADVESQLTDVDADVEDLEEQDVAPPGLGALKQARDSLWQALDDLDGLSPEEFREARPALHRRVAALEGRLERVRLGGMERVQDVRSHLRARLQRTERALSQLEGRLAYARPTVAARYQERTATLRGRHDALAALLRELEGASAADFPALRAEAAEILARLLVELETVTAALAAELDAPDGHS